MTSDRASARQQLLRDGYCVLSELLDPAFVTTLRKRSLAILGALPREHRESNRSQGSLVPLADHPDFADIVGSDTLRAAFAGLEFADPRFSSGYLISKPPGGPPLFWHQDWWGWNDPVSYGSSIPQVFVMIYLSDTSPANGCLRVIPRSHRGRHALHDAPAAHGEALSRVDDPEHPLFKPVEGEIDVPVAAGDVIIGDARLLHAAHGNRSDAERCLLTLWFHPDYQALPDGMRARIRCIFDRTGVDTDAGGDDALTPESWPDAGRLGDLFPDPEYAQPHPWERTPDWSLSAARA